eukprot:g24236.t1
MKRSMLRRRDQHAPIKLDCNQREKLSSAIKILNTRPAFRFAPFASAVKKLILDQTSGLDPVTSTIEVTIFQVTVITDSDNCHGPNGYHEYKSLKTEALNTSC